jgi:hypothetical protein
VKRLNVSLQELEVIGDTQQGFKKVHLTIHTLLRNTECITHSFSTYRVAVEIFLDIRRAFDKAWTFHHI